MDDNTGHGYVWPRPDGKLFRCGGPRICKECKQDEIAYKAAKKTLSAKMQHALDFIWGCYVAAEAEGWSRAVETGDVDRIRDIWNRRLEPAIGQLREIQHEREEKESITVAVTRRGEAG